eukprot:6224465-Amphidinium_carterae.2
MGGTARIRHFLINPTGGKRGVASAHGAELCLRKVCLDPRADALEERCSIFEGGQAVSEEDE